MRKATGESDRFDAVIVGGGLAGLIAGIAAARKGLTVALLAPPVAEPDGRTTALLSDSIAFLNAIGLWDEISGIAYPLRTMRIIDGTNRLFRAPQADFRSSEIGLDAFGYNLENAAIARVFRSLIDGLPAITVIEEMADGLEPGDLPGTHAIVTQSGRRIGAAAILAADGRNSAIRRALAIKTRDWSYPQAAIVTNLEHTLDHHDTSTEFHTETGPFTVVPLGPKRSSLVCVVDPLTADRMISMEPAGLADEFEQRMQSVLGKVSICAPVSRYPLSSLIAERFGTGNVMLIGEAGHAFPPIGAQGLNLGIRDIREAVDLAASDPENCGPRFHRRRAADVTTRTASVDLLNRSLLSGFLPVQMARSVGLFLLASAGPLRRLMMREGVMPGMGLAGLRQPAAPQSDNPA